MAAQTTPDLSEFEALSKRDQRRPCLLGPVFEQLTTAERAKLDAAFAADKHAVTTGGIRDWLAARGHVVSIPAVTTHRKRLCTCHA